MKELLASMLQLLIFLECSLVGTELEIIPQIFKMSFTKTLKVGSEPSFAITVHSTKPPVPRWLRFYSHRAFITQLHPYEIAEVSFT